MCKDDGTKEALPTPMASTSRKQAPRKKQQYGNRGSLIRFITNSFHGVLGSSSLLVTLSAWISNEYYESNSTLPVVLTLLSVFTTTVLSIHSSWYMLEQSPHQSTILDWQLITTTDTKEAEQTLLDAIASLGAETTRETIRSFYWWDGAVQNDEELRLSQ